MAYICIPFYLACLDFPRNNLILKLLIVSKNLTLFLIPKTPNNTLCLCVRERARTFACVYDRLKIMSEEVEEFPHIMQTQSTQRHTNNRVDNPSDFCVIFC